MHFLFKTFLQLLLILLIPINSIAQIELKLNAETGLFLDLNSRAEENTELLNKFLGSLEYGNRSGSNSYKFGFKVRPQFFNTEFHSIKYRLDGTYTLKADNLKWRSDLSYTNYDYSYTSSEYSYGIFQLINIIDLPLNRDLPVSLFFGYSRYDINYSNIIDSDIYFISVSYNKKLTNYSFISFGIFTQKYDMVSNINSGNEFSSNGWKYGPLIKIQYMKDFIFNAEYKFLLYNTNNTKYPSYEHNINLLSGTIINRKISVFLIAKFNFIRTSLKDGITENNPIFYTPTQNENEIYLKTALKLNSSFSVYSKIGYFRENFYLEEFKLDGMNILLGLELKK